MAAVEESSARGYKGELVLHAKNQELFDFYNKLGGELVDPSTNKFFFSEKVSKALSVWSRAGADLRNPLVRNLIKRGQDSIMGGSGRFDDEVIIFYHGSQPKYRDSFKQSKITPFGRGDLDEAFYATRRQDEGIYWAGNRRSLSWTEKDLIAIEINKAEFEALQGEKVTLWEYELGVTIEDYRKGIRKTEQERAEIKATFDSNDYLYSEEVTDLPGYEQFAFKSERAIELLNSSPKSIYRISPEGKLELIERIVPKR